ncbi:MAG: hypothetical protein U0521_06420 [Anaerolineae bacterium]
MHAFTGSPVDYGREFEVMVSLSIRFGLPGPIPGDRQRLTMTTGQSGEDGDCVYTYDFGHDLHSRRAGISSSST